MPRHTLVYYGDWSLWQTGVTGPEVDSTLTFNNLVFAYGFIWTGDVVSNNIGVLVDKATDYGNDNEFLIETYVRGQPREEIEIDRVYLQCTQGQKNDNDSIAFSVSEDGRHYGPEVWERLAGIGDYSREVSWGSPVGDFDNYAGMRFRWTGSISVNTDAASFD